MTFILPEGETRKSIDGVMPGWSAMWSAWPTGFAPGDVADAYASCAAINQAMWEQSLHFMLLPFSALTRADAAPSAAPDGPPAANAVERSAPAAATAAEGETLDAPASIDSVKVAAASAVVAPAPGVARLAAANLDFKDDEIEGQAPKLLSKPDGAPDDLILIKGIGPKLNQLLNSLGVWHFRQIVAWTPAEVAWVNAKIDFKGRIQRERWQPQAMELMKTSKAA